MSEGWDPGVGILRGYPVGSGVRTAGEAWDWIVCAESLPGHCALHSQSVGGLWEWH